MKPVKEGYLDKKNPKVDLWQTRYFELHESSLKYFKSKGEKHARGMVPIGAIDQVSQLEEKQGARFDFSIDGNDRKFALLARSSRDASDWVQALQKAKSDFVASGKQNVSGQGKFWKTTGDTHLVQQLKMSSNLDGGDGAEQPSDDFNLALLMKQKPLCQGILMKKSPKGLMGMKVWQERYFMLYDKVLLYKKKQSDESFQGAIDLRTVDLVSFVSSKKDGCRFDIVVNNGSTVRRVGLLAQSKPECIKWTQTVEKQVDVCRQNKTVFEKAFIKTVPALQKLPSMIAMGHSPRNLIMEMEDGDEADEEGYWSEEEEEEEEAAEGKELDVEAESKFPAPSSSPSNRGSEASVVTTNSVDDEESSSSSEDEDDKQKGPTSLFNSVRGLVSKKKKRFQQDGFDLDLSYITDRIIAMGFPAESVAGVYRNNMKDVQRFFKQRHDDHFKIYNLCSEQGYESDQFGGQCASFPFDDHNPCNFELIIKFCEDASAYLASDPKGVIAVHCKAGKGRTGLMISCLLLFSGVCKSADEALQYFAKARTHNAKGVTIPSQIRYVHYFERFLQGFYRPGTPFDFAGPELTVHGFRLRPKADFDVGGGCDPYFKLWSYEQKEFYNFKKANKGKVKPWKKDPVAIIKCQVPVRGDVKVLFLDADTIGSDDKMFHFWFHTSFIDPSVPLVLPKCQLDKALKDKACEHFPDNFVAELYFQEIDEKALFDDALANPLAPVDKKKKSKDAKAKEVKEAKAESKEPAVVGAEAKERADGAKNAEDEEDTTDDEDESKDSHAKGPGFSAANVVRGLVSKKKKRFQQDGFDLDLSYITERIIAMGFPAESVAGVYRNNMKDVQRFFKQRHDDHFKIYNLCSEQAYEVESFGGSACRFPFDDHNPCAFPMMLAFCRDAKAFLEADDKNVVAIHCKAGKGRTGLMISCLLVFMEICKTANEALRFFAEARTSNAKGVTIPSQIRWVGYFEQYLKEFVLPGRENEFQVPSVKLRGFTLAPKADFDIGGGCDPYFVVTDISGKKLYHAKQDKAFKVTPWKSKTPSEHTVLFPEQLEVSGEFKVSFLDEDALNSDDKMFHFWLHSSFLRYESVVGRMVLTKADLDKAVKDKKCEHFPKNFTCTVLLSAVRSESSVFGKTIDEALAMDQKSCPEAKLPRIASMLLERIRSNGGTKQADLFATLAGANREEFLKLVDQIEAGNYDDLNKCASAHAPAALLVVWLNSLSDTLIPQKLHAQTLAIAKVPQLDSISAMSAIARLSPCTQLLMTELAKLCRDIAVNCEHTNLDISQLASVFAPSFFRNLSADNAQSASNLPLERKFTSLLLQACGN